MQKIILILHVLLAVSVHSLGQSSKRASDYGINIGVMTPGKLNAITDVPGVKVGHVTISQDSVQTGVTAILPHGGNIFQQKVPAAIYVGNGFGKLAGTTQVAELGNLETPIVLTNTLNVGTGLDAVVAYTLHLPGNERVQSVNAVVGETNDGWLNDIRGRHVKVEHVIDAIHRATAGPVVEGNVGAGTGTVCFGFKGGIGTASRVLTKKTGGYTVGVLVQTNFGGVLQIDGVPVGEELNEFYLRDEIRNSADGSCMIVVATDAPLDARNLERLAARAIIGMGKTGGIAANGSGDYVIAFTTDPALRIPFASTAKTESVTLLRNDEMSPLFMAAIEATEEAIVNSLFAAKTLKGNKGREIRALPVEEVIRIMKKYNRIR
ncbi:MAG TPA: P1 family peptidase [Chryseosolibacter sp.]|nr:P1 family peptidase [Chryseosolibacter sp.]